MEILLLIHIFYPFISQFFEKYSWIYFWRQSHVRIPSWWWGEFRWSMTPPQAHQSQQLLERAGYPLDGSQTWPSQHIILMLLLARERNLRIRFPIVVTEGLFFNLLIIGQIMCNPELLVVFGEMWVRIRNLKHKLLWFIVKSPLRALVDDYGCSQKKLKLDMRKLTKWLLVWFRSAMFWGCVSFKNGLQASSVEGALLFQLGELMGF